MGTLSRTPQARPEPWSDPGLAYSGAVVSSLLPKEGAMAMGRVLVVDDEADIRKSVRMVLEKAGYNVVDAEDGEKGIAAIRSGDNPLLVDTIICDLKMPKINGQEAIAYFRAQFPSVPVIVLTGHPDVKGAADLFKLGIKDYLVKPIEPEKLKAIVAKAIKEHELFKDKFKT